MRSRAMGASQNKRIRYANDLLQKEFFPHISVGDPEDREGWEIKKGEILHSTRF